MNHFDWLFDEQRRLFLEMKWVEMQRPAQLYIVAYNERMRKYLEDHPECLKPGSIIPMKQRGDLEIIRPTLRDW